MLDLPNTLSSGGVELSLFDSLLWVDDHNLLCVGNKNNRILASSGLDHGMGAVCFDVFNGSVVYNFGLDDNPATAGLCDNYKAAISSTGDTRVLCVPIYKWVTKYNTACHGFIRFDAANGNILSTVYLDGMTAVGVNYYSLGIVWSEANNCFINCTVSGNIVQYNPASTVCTVTNLPVTLSNYTVFFGNKFILHGNHLYLAGSAKIYKLTLDAKHVVAEAILHSEIIAMISYGDLIYARTRDNAILVFDENFELTTVLTVRLSSTYPTSTSPLLAVDNGRLVLVISSLGVDISILSIDLDCLYDFSEIYLRDKSIKLTRKRNLDRYHLGVTAYPSTQPTVLPNRNLVTSSVTNASPYTVTDLDVSNMSVIHNTEF